MKTTHGHSARGLNFVFIFCVHPRKGSTHLKEHRQRRVGKGEDSVWIDILWGQVVVGRKMFCMIIFLSFGPCYPTREKTSKRLGYLDVREYPTSFSGD